MPSFVPLLQSQPVAISSAAQDGTAHQPRAWAARFVRWCDLCLERCRQRQVLADLEDHLLADIGVTRQQAMAEAAKPFWK